MRKLLSLGIISALVLVSLTGCFQQQQVTEPEDKDTTEVEEMDDTEDVEVAEDEEDAEEEALEDEEAMEEGWLTYENDEIGFKFMYPADMTVEKFDASPELFALSVNKPEKFGFFDDIRIYVEPKGYNEMMAAQEIELYKEVMNWCDNEEIIGTPTEPHVVGCTAVKEGVTSYMNSIPLGDITLFKTYYIETGNAEWPEAEMDINLLSDDDYQRYMESEGTPAQAPLEAHQKAQVELGDSIFETLEFK